MREHVWCKHCEEYKIPRKLLLIEAINKYFGYEVKDLNEFREEFGDDVLYHEQTFALVEFLRWYERVKRDE